MSICLTHYTSLLTEPCTSRNGSRRPGSQPDADRVSGYIDHAERKFQVVRRRWGWSSGKKGFYECIFLHSGLPTEQAKPTVSIPCGLDQMETKLL